MSLALRDDRSLLDCNPLFAGRCRVGTLCCGQACKECPDGDIGGVNGFGDIIDTEEGDPGSKLIAAAAAISIDLGDGTADPVDRYSGRSCSAV